MKSTFKTLFYLKKNEPKKNGHVVIMVRITVDGDQVQFSSKLDIHPDNWDTKAGRAVINKQSTDKKENLRVSSLNKTLDEIRSAITMHYTRMMNVDGYALPEKSGTHSWDWRKRRKRSSATSPSTMNSMQRRSARLPRKDLFPLRTDQAADDRVLAEGIQVVGHSRERNHRYPHRELLPLFASGM